MPRPGPFQPQWCSTPPPPGSWRSLLKWGDPTQFKHPNAGLYRELKRILAMEDTDFRRPRQQGLDPVDLQLPPALAPEILAGLEDLLGPANVATGVYPRLAVAYGKTMVDLMRLREGIAEHLPDAVLHPRDHHDVVRILAFCAARGIPVIPFGGGSSVTRGLECPRGGVTLDLRTHMNKVLRFNETDQTITVEAGLYGPELEKLLNGAPELLGATRRYTCGHFPQSFEFSTVGGWVMTRGAGQNSTYHGKIEDRVLSMAFAAPAGVLRTGNYPAAATGPDTDQILMGSEGAFGVLTEVTLKVARLLPGYRFSYLFPTWAGACAAAREVLQAQGGNPSAFRLSDPEETDLMLKLYGVQGRGLDTLLGALGLAPGRRCLLLGSTEGERGFARNARRVVRRICRAHGARSTTGLVTRSWEAGRFRDPYLREDLQDYGVILDTLECAATWDTLDRVHQGVRAHCRTRPHTLCLTHLSHAYPQGANLYFIFMARMDSIPEYLAFQGGLLDAIQRHGAALSHHHGIGKMSAPWLQAHLGRGQMDLFRAIKAHLDPQGIMNPGGTLGLDLPEGQRRGKISL